MTSEDECYHMADHDEYLIYIGRLDDISLSYDTNEITADQAIHAYSEVEDDALLSDRVHEDDFRSLYMICMLGKRVCELEGNL